MLLLWAGDKGLEIYNAARLEDEADKFKLKPIFEKFEAYTKPQSIQILSRYQLSCLNTRTLIDSGYDPAFKDETLRDTLIFGLKSDKVRKDAISKGNSLTFQQVYDLAKTEESTKAQMQVIKQGDENTGLFSVRSKKKAASYEGSKSASSSRKVIQAMALNPTAHLPANQSSNLNSVVVSDVETNMIVTLHAQLRMLSASQQAIKHVGLPKTTVLKEYHDCFDKIGRFPGDQYHIKLVNNPTPVVHPPRTVPVHILPLYKAELDKMIADDVITEVTEPTAWVNSIVCNIKETSDGKKKVRLCLDPKDLNKIIRREHYYSRTIDEILPSLHGKNYFSVVDTTKGYWHVELDHESSFLCTFNTPFGRYRFKRLPFGIVVSQDIFQRMLDNIYKNIPNVTGIADNIIVFGSTEEEHDQAFVNMLEATRANNVSLNSDKLQFKQQSVNFFGHTLTADGILPAADKLEALRNISAPSNTKELLFLLGLVTYLNRFSSKVAELTQPLRELTKKNVHFRWKQHHQTALDRIKEELCSAPVLSYYDPDPARTTILQCDASQKGLGAWV
ncbi:hypothetical protein ACROYT_G014376 [Oculina patagonica]